VTVRQTTIVPQCHANQVILSSYQRPQLKI
jgi:hypothetical protein